MACPYPFQNKEICNNELFIGSNYCVRHRIFDPDWPTCKVCKSQQVAHYAEHSHKCHDCLLAFQKKKDKFQQSTGIPLKDENEYPSLSKEKFERKDSMTAWDKEKVAKIMKSETKKSKSPQKPKKSKSPQKPKSIEKQKSIENQSDEIKSSEPDGGVVGEKVVIENVVDQFVPPVEQVSVDKPEVQIYQQMPVEEMGFTIDHKYTIDGCMTILGITGLLVPDDKPRLMEMHYNACMNRNKLKREASTTLINFLDGILPPI